MNILLSSLISSKVADATPYPGMQVHPACGCVPVGGVVGLTVIFKPQKVGAFDVKLGILLQEGKGLSLRVAGSVEQPIVTIDQVINLL